MKLVKTYTLKRGAYDIARARTRWSTPAARRCRRSCTCSWCATATSCRASRRSIPPSPARRSTPRRKKFQKVEFSDIEKNKAEFEKTATNGYVAMVQHYFASAWILPDGMQARALRAQGRHQPVLGRHDRAAAASRAGRARRPSTATLLRRPAGRKDAGAASRPAWTWSRTTAGCTILAKPLYWLLDKLHGFIGNWGWSIVALVLLIKIAFYWLQAKGYESMAKMKAINPKIMAMRERLQGQPAADAAGDDAHLPRGEGQPDGRLPARSWCRSRCSSRCTGCCCPSVEMRNAPWIGWIHDLSAPDPYFILPVVMTADHAAADRR